MFEIVHMLQGVVERGLVFGPLVASVYIASRLIDFDNLAVEGAFGLGGALTALLMFKGLNPWIALTGAVACGALSGIITGLLHTKLKLNKLITGIVVTTGLFSINLKIAGSNLALTGKSTIFSSLPLMVAPYQQLLLLVILMIILFGAISWFLTTEVGYLLRTAGDTPQMLVNIGKSVDFYIILGLMISNMLAALSGALFVQYSGYFSIWTNVGVLIIGLAGMILAQTFSRHFGLVLVLGSILYQAILSLTFELQLDQNWNKLITAVLIVVLIVMNQSLKKK
jgi:putative ABC transport system permease protein